MRDDPTWKVNALKKTMKRDLALDTFMQEMYRAMKKALPCINGDGKQKFFKLWD